MNEAAIYDGHVSEYDFQVYQSFQHPSEDAIPQGISGYDPEEKDMQGVFMARGPGAFVTPFTLFNHTLPLSSTTKLNLIASLGYTPSVLSYCSN